MTKKRIIDIAENLGWSVKFGVEELVSEKGKYVEFSQYSPAGQDFSFTVWYDNLNQVADRVKDFYISYDIKEEVYTWLEAKRNGVSGVPDVITLVHDQEDIEEMLGKLALDLK